MIPYKCMTPAHRATMWRLLDQGRLAAWVRKRRQKIEERLRDAKIRCVPDARDRARKEQKRLRDELRRRVRDDDRRLRGGEVGHVVRVILHAAEHGLAATRAALVAGGAAP